MKKLHHIALLGWLIVLAGGLGFGWSARADALSDQLQQIRSYEFGQNRRALDAMEAEVNAARANPARRQEVARRLARFLTTKATYAAKQFVCRQLVLIAGADQVPILARLLADGHLSHMALYALMPIPGPVASRALRRALGRTTGRNRIAVITALGERHDPGAVGPLAGFLDSVDTETAQAAGAALARIGNIPAANALRTALRRAAKSRRPALEQDCLACAGQLRAAKDADYAKNLYRFLYENASDPVVHAGALRGLARRRGQKGWPLALAALAERARPTRRMAAALLLELPGPLPVPLLEKRMPSFSPPARVYVLKALGQRGTKKALGLVERLVNAKEPAVRLAALQTLGLLGDASSVGALAHYAVHGTPEEQDAARASLRRIAAPGVDQAIVHSLSTVTAGEQIELVRALGDRGAQTAVPGILTLARNGSLQVRQSALEALEQLSGPSQLSQLIDLLLALSPGERSAAIQTVATVARRAPTEAQRTAVILARLAQAHHLEDQRSLLQVLGRVGGPEALRNLRRVLNHGPQALRMTALRILADWPTDAPMQDLLQAARHDHDSQAQAVALRGFIRQIGLENTRPPQASLALYRQALDLATGKAAQAAVLSGLYTVRTKAALELAASKLADPNVRPEAAAAVVALAQELCGAYPAAVRTRLQQVLRLPVRATLSAKAKAVLQQMDRLGDYLSAWQVSPAYTKAGAGATQLFDVAFPPEEGNHDVAWQVMPAGTNPQQPWLLDLLAALGGNDRVAYLRTRLHSDRNQTLRLEIGSDDGVKAWLNSKVILADNVMRAIAPGQEKVNVHLHEGWNQLLLKITQNNMGWGACARLRNLDGSPATGVRAALPEE